MDGAESSAPPPQPLLHLTTIFMMTPFSAETGGTHLLPGSHCLSNNPAGRGMPEFPGSTYEQPISGEVQLRGAAGDVFVSDSRLWHAVATNRTREPRVGLLVRYCPWYLNLTPTIQGTSENQRMVVDTGGKN